MPTCFAGGQAGSQGLEGLGAPTCARASKQMRWRWRASGVAADTSEQYPARSDEPEFQFANGATARLLPIQRAPSDHRASPARCAGAVGSRDKGALRYTSTRVPYSGALACVERRKSASFMVE